MFEDVSRFSWPYLMPQEYSSRAICSGVLAAVAIRYQIHIKVLTSCSGVVRESTWQYRVDSCVCVSRHLSMDSRLAVASDIRFLSPFERSPSSRVAAASETVVRGVSLSSVDTLDEELRIYDDPQSRWMKETERLSGKGWKAGSRFLTVALWPIFRTYFTAAHSAGYLGPFVSNLPAWIPKEKSQWLCHKGGLSVISLCPEPRECDLPVSKFFVSFILERSQNGVGNLYRPYSRDLFHRYQKIDYKNAWSSEIWTIVLEDAPISIILIGRWWIDYSN